MAEPKFIEYGVVQGNPIVWTVDDAWFEGEFTGLVAELLKDKSFPKQNESVEALNDALHGLDLPTENLDVALLQALATACEKATRSVGLRICNFEYLEANLDSASDPQNLILLDINYNRAPEGDSDFYGINLLSRAYQENIDRRLNVCFLTQYPSLQSQLQSDHSKRFEWGEEVFWEVAYQIVFLIKRPNLEKDLTACLEAFLRRVPTLTVSQLHGELWDVLEWCSKGNGILLHPANGHPETPEQVLEYFAHAPRALESLKRMDFGKQTDCLKSLFMRDKCDYSLSRSVFAYFFESVGCPWHIDPFDAIRFKVNPGAVTISNLLCLLDKLIEKDKRISLDGSFEVESGALWLTLRFPQREFKRFKAGIRTSNKTSGLIAAFRRLVSASPEENNGEIDIEEFCVHFPQLKPLPSDVSETLIWKKQLHFEDNNDIRVRIGTLVS
jgi:hypothetical protein